MKNEKKVVCYIGYLFYFERNNIIEEDKSLFKYYMDDL